MTHPFTEPRQLHQRAPSRPPPALHLVSRLDELPSHLGVKPQDPEVMLVNAEEKKLTLEQGITVCNRRI